MAKLMRVVDPILFEEFLKHTYGKTQNVENVPESSSTEIANVPPTVQLHSVETPTLVSSQLAPSQPNSSQLQVEEPSQVEREVGELRSQCVETNVPKQRVITTSVSDPPVKLEKSIGKNWLCLEQLKAPSINKKPAPVNRVNKTGGKLRRVSRRRN